MMPFIYHAEGKASTDPAIYLPFISAPARKWITAYEWGTNDRGGRTIGMLEIGQNRYKLIGSEFVIYLKGDGTVDHAAYITSGGVKFTPMSAGRYIAGEPKVFGECDARVALFDHNDENLWKKVVRLPAGDCMNELNLTSADDAIYLHQTFQHSPYGHNAWLAKLDDQGDLAWSKVVGQGWIAGPFAMTVAADGGLIFTTARSVSGYPVIVADLDGAGQLVRAREIRPSSGTVYYVPWGISRTTDGGTILTGSNSENQGWALKLDKAWEIVWKKQYTLPSEAHLYSAKGSNDGGVILQSIRDIVKIHADGSVAWARSYGHQTRGIYLNDVKEAGDDNILVAASLQGVSSHHPLSMRLDPDGLVANCDVIRSETVESAELDLVMSSTTVAMQDISVELRALDPAYTGPIEAGSDALCGSGATAECEKLGE